MFQAYWGLSRSPFSRTAARESLSRSPIHAEALARLDFLRENRGSLGLLLGPAGSGKSAVLAEFAERAARSGAIVASLPTVAAEERHVLPPLAEALHLSPASDLWVLWRQVVDRLSELRLDGSLAVVLLDDLDRTTASTLALVERLLGLPEAPLLVVGTARPETTARIGSPILDQVALRIELSAWSESETREHLQHSLAAAGRVQPAFAESAARRLFELSGGAPRRVNQLAQLALLAGAGRQLAIIDAETIDGVQQELSVCE
jgi:type II secretory pathway predicted ATPase ExeA